MTYLKKDAIGKGAFSTVWRDKKNPDMVRVETSDHVKECMGMGWFPKSPLFPTVERTEEIGVYSMRFYPTAKSKAVTGLLCEHDAELYKALRNLSVNYWSKKAPYELWTEAFNSLPEKFAEEKETLLEALDALTNYGDDACFEISPRNVACENGKLILLDCFFLQSQLAQVR